MSVIQLVGKASERLPAVRNAVVIAFGLLLTLALSSGHAGGLKLWAGLAALALLALAVWLWPRMTAPLLMAVVALLPIYWAVQVAIIPVAPTPAVVVGGAFLPLAVLTSFRIRLHRLDAAVAAFLVLTLISEVVTSPSVKQAVAQTLADIAIPYLCLRCLALDKVLRQRIYAALCISAGVLAIVAIREHSNVKNPFFTLITPHYLASLWARPEFRGGKVRAEASFGHPIALGMFLAWMTVTSMGLAFATPKLRLRIAWLGNAVLCTTGVVFTLSRGPLVMLALGALIWVVAEYRSNFLKALAYISVGVGVFLATPAFGYAQTLYTNTFNQSNDAASARYRLDIVHVVEDPKNFSWFGLTPVASGLDGPIQGVLGATGNASTDLEYAVIFLDYGFLATVGFVWVGVLFGRSSFAKRISATDRAWAAGLTATLVAFLSVASLTQFKPLFWFGIGIIGAVQQGTPKPIPATTTTGTAT